MLDGTYTVSAQTPIGAKRGEVTFATDAQGALRATLKVSGLKIALTSAKAAGDSFELAGTISHFLMGHAPFTCTGSVEGSRIAATARSGSVTISLNGTRK